MKQAAGNRGLFFLGAPCNRKEGLGKDAESWFRHKLKAITVGRRGISLKPVIKELAGVDNLLSSAED